MRISEEGKITSPKHLRDRFDTNSDVEITVAPVGDGLLIQKGTVGQHPVERVYGILNGGNTDEYLDEVRGR